MYGLYKVMLNSKQTRVARSRIDHLQLAGDFKKHLCTMLLG